MKFFKGLAIGIPIALAMWSGLIWATFTVGRAIADHNQTYQQVEATALPRK